MVGTNRSWTKLVPLLLCNTASITEAFTPNKVLKWKNPIAFHHPSAPLHQTVSTPSSLSMGILEDFITTTDEKNLVKENEAFLKTLEKRMEKINALEPTMEDLSDDELLQKTKDFRTRLQGGEDVNGPIVEEAFAVVREAAWRVLELRHYDVQLLGGMVLHSGRLAEMCTGEGKTLVATLPVYLNALTGRPSFVITVNEYLAKRDAEKMGQVYRFLGLSVGLITADMKEEERQRNYRCDVVYVTNSELGFDYLRDHLAVSPQGTVLPWQRGAASFDAFCVVDEADSVLIDEARTPLIISKQEDAPSAQYQTALKLANVMDEGLHYTVDKKNKNIELKERAYRDCENALKIDSLFTVQKNGYGAWAPFIINAVKAKELFTKDVDYTVMTDDTGEKIGVGIIDSFTGRVLDGRRWSDGQHQSIEVREGIAVSSQSKVIAKVTYQSLFRLFSRLSAMTGTAMSDALEFANTYDLLVTPIPTNLPVARRDYPDLVYKTRNAADNALVNELIDIGAGTDEGRPCLIGTTSLSQSEALQQKLKKAGIPAELLNANPLNAQREGEIIAQAGRVGKVTVATNMAGRGTDILLGGCPNTMATIKIRSILVPLLLKEKDAAKLPPAPQESYFPAPLPDTLLSQLQQTAKDIQTYYQKNKKEMTPLQLEEIITTVTETTEGPDDPDHILSLRDIVSDIYDIYKPILAEEKAIVQKKGGLYVMGTNRHESSRIDNQLRGRAGRQGDPGTSRFFLSFQDEMFLLFGKGLDKILTAFRVSEDMPVEAQQVTDSLNAVQKQVEEKYREMRYQILEFDVVLEGQRRVIYNRRQGILFSNEEDTMKIIQGYNEQTVRDIVNAQVVTAADGGTEKDTVNVDKVLEKIQQFFPPVGNVVLKDDLVGLDPEGVIGFIDVAVDEIFQGKAKEMDEQAKASNKPPNALARTANYLTLVSIDNAWSDHLQNMENLKESVILRKYQQLDIVAEYKREAFELFQGLEDTMRLNSVYSVWQNI